jgi:hypothetical protein
MNEINIAKNKWKSVKLRVKSNKLAYWIVWVFLFTSVICYRFVLGVDNPEEEPLLTPPFFLSLSLVFCSLVCRVLILPRGKNKIPIYVVGIAMAESLSLVGIFLMPYYQDFFTAMSLAAILCYLPIFIKTEKSK